MHNEALRKRCASLWDIAERFRALLKHYGVLWSVTEHTECCVTLQDVTEQHGSVVDCYGSITELIQLLQKISTLPITHIDIYRQHVDEQGVRSDRCGWVNASTLSGRRVRSVQ